MPTIAAVLVLSAIQAQISEPQCTVLGRVLDQLGQPIADAEVLLSPSDGPWRADRETPRVALRDGSERAGFACGSDEAGRFIFEVPAPTCTRTWLLVRPGPYLGLVDRSLGSGLGQEGVSLVPGVNDLGDLVCLPKGAIAGRVVDVDGEPIEGASLRPQPGLGPVTHTTSAADGSFFLGHVVVGSVQLTVRREGYFRLDEARAVDVLAGETTGAEYVLLPSRPVTGRVVSELGIGLAEVRVHASPHGGGYMSDARTDRDGSFTLFLQQDGPHRLELSRADLRPRNGKTVRPGDDGLEYTMYVAPTLRVRVVGGEGQPVERFGIRLFDCSWNSSPDTKVADCVSAPGGVREVVLPDRESGWRVEAPGFAPQEGEVRIDDEELVVRLTAGGVIAGRASRDGKPLHHAVLRLARDRTDEDPSYNEYQWGLDEWVFLDKAETDLSPGLGRLRQAVADDEGRFQFADLAPGTWRLEGTTSDGLLGEARRVRIQAGERVEFDPFDLAPGASLRGRLVAPAGTELAGIEVSLAGADGRTGVDGRFGFEGLPPGTHYLVIQLDPLTNESASYPLKFARGEHLEREFDVSSHFGRFLRLLLQRNGEPLANARVRMLAGKHQRKQAGTSDRRGRLDFLVPEDGAPFEVTSEFGLTLGGGAFPPRRSAGPALELDLPTGDLALSLPTEFMQGPDTFVEVNVRTYEGTHAGQVLVEREPEALEYPWAPAVTWVPEETPLGPIAPGRYVVEVTPKRMEEVAPRQFVIKNAGEPVRSWIEVKRGERTVCTIER